MNGLMHSPLSPVHRQIGGALIFMVLTFVAWAAFGKLDIVVQAQGKLVPASAVKVSQPVEAGPVVALLVKNGDVVKAGQLLARLDSVSPDRDSDALKSDQTLAKARLAAIDAALLGKEAPVSTAVVDSEFLLRYSAYQDAQRSAQAALEKAESELAATRESLQKQQRTLVLASASEKAHADLQAEGFVSNMAYQDKLKDKIEREQDAATLSSTVKANLAAVAQAKASLSQVSSDYKRQLAQERTQVLTQLQKTEAELSKAQHRSELTEVRAPVSGTVNSLAVHTPGQVVAAGSALLSIVPSEEQLVAEAWVRNEDVGFVSPGMPVKVKLVTFPFQKYGWLTGEVTVLGADSEVPEAFRNSQGEPLFYKARITLQSQSLVRDGKHFVAKPGMQAVADIQLGERSLLEYLTSPLKKTVLEAARER